ncbi:hypothetical protein DFH09DRAFT_1339327 [Mycena vulgaris]|nr:hypothetical protein DFH09DRAFT_1339327 [Mycena vulgaris]
MPALRRAQHRLLLRWRASRGTNVSLRLRPVDTTLCIGTSLFPCVLSRCFITQEWVYPKRPLSQSRKLHCAESAGDKQQLTATFLILEFSWGKWNGDEARSLKELMAAHRARPANILPLLDAAMRELHRTAAVRAQGSREPFQRTWAAGTSRAAPAVAEHGGAGAGVLVATVVAIAEVLGRARAVQGIQAKRPRTRRPARGADTLEHGGKYRVQPSLWSAGPATP